MTTKSIPTFGTMEEYSQDPLGFLEKARDQGDIVKLIADLPQLPYLLSNPEHIRELLIEKYTSFHKNLGDLKVLTGQGLITAEGEAHKKNRQAIAPLFSPRNVSGYAPTMVRIAEDRIQSWADGETRDIADEMVAITLDIIVDTMFGISVWEVSAEDDIREQLSPLSKLIVDKGWHEGREPEEVSAERNRKIAEHIAELDKMVYRIMDKRRKNPNEERRDMLSILLRTDMPDPLIRDEMMTIFMAGHDSTAKTLAWTFYMLSQHPEVERKFHEELDRVVGDKTPTADMLKDLTYTHYVVLETLRLYPATWAIGRVAAEDVEIGGHLFKQGEAITLCQWSMHRDPKWYDNTEQFIPERWESDLAKTNPTFAYFPFGGGMRGCSSKDFAMMEALLVLATVGQRYRLTLPLGTVIKPAPLLTLHPIDLNMQIQKR